MPKDGKYDRQTATFLGRVGENMPELSAQEMQRLIDDPITLQKVLEKAFRSNYFIHLTLPITLVQPSWANRLLEDAEFQLAGQTVSLDLVDFLQSGESFVSGEVMVSRSVKQGNLAGNRAFQFLCKKTNSIPNEWRKFDLIFPGTIWYNAEDSLYVQHMFWSGNRLNWDYCRWFGGSFCSNCRVVRVHLF